MFRQSLLVAPSVWFRCLLAALLLTLAAGATAQTAPTTPDSLRVVATPADTTGAAPVGIAPDAPAPVEKPLSRRTRWLVVGVCVLITVSTFLLYNVRSR